MKKNGMIDVTVMLIAAVLAAAVTLGITYQLYTNVSEEKIVEQCRTSYLAAHLVKSTTADFARGRIDCPLQELQVKNSEDIVGGLRDCWYKTLGMKNKIGKFVLPVPLIGDTARDVLSADQSFCLVCASFTPSEDMSVQDVKTVLNNGVSKRDGMSYNLFLENTNWNSLDRFFLMFNKKISPNTVLKGFEDSNVQPLLSLKSNTTYWIMSQSFSDSPSMFVTESKKVSNAPCSVTHYQNEAIAS